jgi:hypothetical protein
MILTEIVLILVCSILFYTTLHYRATTIGVKVLAEKKQYYLVECREMLKYSEEQVKLLKSKLQEADDGFHMQEREYEQSLQAMDSELDVRAAAIHDLEATIVDLYSTINHLTSRLYDQDMAHAESLRALDWELTGAVYDGYEATPRQQNKMFRELSNAKAKSRTGKMSSWGRK